MIDCFIIRTVTFVSQLVRIRETLVYFRYVMFSKFYFVRTFLKSTARKISGKKNNFETKYRCFDRSVTTSCVFVFVRSYVYSIL